MGLRQSGFFFWGGGSIPTCNPNRLRVWILQEKCPLWAWPKLLRKQSFPDLPSGKQMMVTEVKLASGKQKNVFEVLKKDFLFSEKQDLQPNHLISLAWMKQKIFVSVRDVSSLARPFRAIAPMTGFKPQAKKKTWSTVNNRDNPFNTYWPACIFN